jgi:nucleotide-binding universal stress UspA family protein
VEILVPVDGSGAALWATRVAADFARRSHRLRLLHVVDVRFIEPLGSPSDYLDALPVFTEEDNDTLSAYAEEGRDVLAAAAETCRDAGVAHLRDTAIGIPHDVILKRSRDVGALVIAKQGFSTRELGVTATAAVTRAQCPVVTLRTHHRVTKALLVVDARDVCVGLARLMGELLLPDEVDVTVLADPSDSDAAGRVEATLEGAGFRVDARDDEGTDAEAVLAAAASEDFDLIAIGGAEQLRTGMLRREAAAVRLARRTARLTLSHVTGRTKVS